ncbi:unnamed protein product [Didymodactylos carnosus]|uniref:Uncharacterized protein n=1 Tax=Didymodactylos carnosus TaxID=1234261 RepID=A0A814DY84_9BILA|nr:unnamed protein product [Didymodactylos carnosus]CAF0961256.1 unnamed protein product [Didymodactylos carnosus]CAF3677724.1 unnamed protein product [Didymodactylos carnosus]CAF3735716.1 unnamed protein product [Didymodactylos carnosus]
MLYHTNMPFTKPECSVFPLLLIFFYLSKTALCFTFEQHLRQDSLAFLYHRSRRFVFSDAHYEIIARERQKELENRHKKREEIRAVKDEAKKAWQTADAAFKADPNNDKLKQKANDLRRQMINVYVAKSRNLNAIFIDANSKQPKNRFKKYGKRVTIGALVLFVVGIVAKYLYPSLFGYWKNKKPQDISEQTKKSKSLNTITPQIGIRMFDCAATGDV